MNPPYAFDRPWGGGEARRIWQRSIRDSIQGVVKIRVTTTSIRQSIGKAQLGRCEPQLWISQGRKQWFLRSSNHPRRTGRSRRPAGPPLRTDMAKQGFFILLRWLIGFFILLRWLIGVFRPLHQQGFSSCQFISFPCVRSSLRRPRQDPYQTLIKELTTTIVYYQVLYVLVFL